MRLAKTTFLAVLLAAAALATIGPAPAAATELCSEAVYPCEGARYPAKTEIKANLKAGSEAVFKGSITVACKASTISGLTLAEESTPLKVEVTGMTFSKCSGCEAVEATALPWSGNIEEVEVGEGNGTLTLTSQSLVLSKCSGNKCTEEAPGMVLDVIGGEKAEVLAKEEKVKVSGGFCGTSSSFTASYEVTQPAPMQVGPRRTALCDTNPANNICPGTKTYPAFTPVEGWSTTVKFAGFMPEKACAEAGITGETSYERFAPLYGSIATFEFPSGCEGCTVIPVYTAPLGWFTMELRTLGNGDGRLTTLNPKLKFTCGGNSCLFEKPTTNFTFFGGFPAAIRPGGARLDQNMAACGAGTWPVFIEWFGQYAVTSPTPGYVTW